MNFKIWIPAFAGMTILLTACSDSTVYTNAAKQPVATTAESAELGAATITQDAFLFASPFPARILIPDIDGMRSTAFVVSTLNPSGVVALDLDSHPVRVSATFKGLRSPSHTGLPNNLAIQNSTRGFLLTSSHLIDFNPTTGAVRAAVAMPKSIPLLKPLPLSGPLDFDNDGDVDTEVTEIPVSFPGGILVTGNTLWVTTANYLRYATPAVAAPGVLLRYPLTDDGPATPSITITSGYNPTGIVAVGDRLLVTNSGVLNISGGEASPQTASSVDIVDIATGGIMATVHADLSALAFFPPMVDAEAQVAYYGSSAFSEVYQLDIAQKKWTRGLLDPIAIGPPDTADFLTAIARSDNGRYAFVGSFDHSRVFVLDIQDTPARRLATSYRVGFEKGVTAENPSGATTGVSDIAIRPGTPGVDFKGPEIFVLTGTPGTLVTIGTTGSPPAATVTRLRMDPTLLPLQVGKVSWLTASALFSDGDVKAVSLRWTSDNPKVASVSSDGLVTAIAPGITTVRASVGGVTASATVLVHEGAITETPATSGPPTPAATPPPQQQQQQPPPAQDGGKLVVITCKEKGLSPYITQVIGTAVGSGGGANQDKLPGIVVGPPHGIASGLQGNAVDIYSLGSKGEITVAFDKCHITDGPGVDFIVFENAFFAGGNPNAPFSEPAVVGVSMDGIAFTHFPCDLSQSPKYPGCAGTHPVYANPDVNTIDPLDPAQAGGDPFDLATIGVKEARFVRITDQGLSPLQGANGTNGFDLDAIAIVHGVTATPPPN